MAVNEQKQGNKKESPKPLTPKSTSEKLDLPELQQNDATFIIQRARLDPGSLPPPDAQLLQCTIGNQAFGRLLAQRKTRKTSEVSSAAIKNVIHNGNSSRITTIQRNLADARNYATGIPLALSPLPSLATNQINQFIKNTENPEMHRIGLRDAYNNNLLPAQQIDPPDLRIPVGVPAQRAARTFLYNNWIGDNLNSTQYNIAQSFTPAVGGAPPPATLGTINTDPNSAAIGHDGASFGFGLWALVSSFNPPPLYLSAWLWNRGMAWSPALNSVFLTDIINTATITDVHLASNHFTAILDLHINNNAAQRAAMPAHGGSVAGEIKRLLRAGFTWNGTTLHR